MLTRTLLSLASRHDWRLHAWAVLDNHYHFIADSPDQAASLRSLISGIHSVSALAVNRLDGMTGRRVWFQYWDTCITGIPAYYARMRYVMENPVKHGIVADAVTYPYCSSATYLADASRAEVRRLLSFGCSRVRVPDDF